MVCNRTMAAVLMLLAMTTSATAGGRMMKCGLSYVPQVPGVATGQDRDISDAERPVHWGSLDLRGGAGGLTLHLHDGSVLRGELARDHLAVITAFGELQVPVSQLRLVRLGMQRQPQRLQQVQRWMEDLCNGEQGVAELAKQHLESLDPLMIEIVDRARKACAADLYADRADAVMESLFGFGEMFHAEAADWRLRPLTHEDRVEAEALPIAGTVAAQTLALRTKMGTLRVEVDDIRAIERRTPQPTAVTGGYKLDGQFLTGRKFLATKLHLRRGDVVHVDADGQITMTPWGQQAVSTPDGSTNYNWYVQNRLVGGALIGRIGSRGEAFHIGAGRTFEAKTSGEMYLAVAMHPSYVSDSHKFPGEYKVQVTVYPTTERPVRIAAPEAKQDAPTTQPSDGEAKPAMPAGASGEAQGAAVPVIDPRLFEVHHLPLGVPLRRVSEADIYQQIRGGQPELDVPIDD